MDNIDLQILSILKDNARMKASAIANVVNLSVSAVTERIKKLETSGIIEKYTLMVDQKKIGNDVSAVIEVAIEHPRYIDSFINLVTSIPNIISCYCVTGDYDFILKVIFRFFTLNKSKVLWDFFIENNLTASSFYSTSYSFAVW